MARLMSLVDRNYETFTQGKHFFTQKNKSSKSKRNGSNQALKKKFPLLALITKLYILWYNRKK